MKTRIHNSDAPPGAAWPMLVLCLSTLICQPSTLLSQGTAFTYQGRLNDQGAPASGSYDLTFTLFGTNSGGNASAGPLTNSATILSNGLFTATLDFGSEFDGSALWLEIAARTNGNGAFSTLSPRQPIMPAPYAVYAANAGNAATAGIAGSANSIAAANLTGTVADSQLSSNIVRLNIPNTTTQATGGVVVTSGFITGANVTNGGSGYTAAPSVRVADVSGSNAVITATASSGSVMSLTVQNAGSHYSAGTTLTIAPPPSNAYQTFNSGNVFNGVNTFTSRGNTFTGSFTGNGSSLSNLNAAQLTGTAGNLSADAMTISSNLYLPAATATAGIIYSGGSTLVHAYGSQNFFAGSGAGNLTLTGLGQNVGIGFNALRNDTTGIYNTAIGWSALLNNTSGNWNTADGRSALIKNTTGYNNTAVGHVALQSNTTGYNNTATGVNALGNNTSGYQNTAAGLQALFSNTTGGDNTAVGFNALYSNTTSSQNTANGYEALYSNTGSNNTANGFNALSLNTTGGFNTASGHGALANNTTASDNTASGYQALWSNTTGSNNTATGLQALWSNTTGTHNVADGFQALLSNTTGGNNIALGYQAGYNITTGSSNIDIGNLGVAGESSTIRLGTPGIHSNTFIAGVIIGDGSGLTNLNLASLTPPAAPIGMALIPAGMFTIGDITDTNLNGDAAPTNITVSAFFMDVNLVTLSQWRSVYYWATNHGYRLQEGAGKAANHPVQMVDWYDTVKWCNARSQQAGLTPVYYTNASFTQIYTAGDNGTTVYANWAAKGYRLPTEAEWEKAARGGLSGQRFPWGNVIDESLANYYGNTNSYPYDVGPNGSNAAFTNGAQPYTSSAGYFAANGYGLYDMAGNMDEWCWDWYDVNLSSAGSPYAGGTDPRGPASGSGCVLRGGNWGLDASSCRTGSRGFGAPPSQNGILFGFRSVVPSG